MWRRVIALLVLYSVRTAAATNRFISTEGTDAGNDCINQQLPCRTIGRALTQAAQATPQLQSDKKIR